MERSFANGKVQLPSLRELRGNPDELVTYEALHAELLDLLQGRGNEPGEVEQRSLLDFDGGDIVIICPDAPPDAQGPLAAEDSPNYTLLHQFADIDALIAERRTH